MHHFLPELRGLASDLRHLRAERAVMYGRKTLAEALRHNMGLAELEDVVDGAKEVARAAGAKNVPMDIEAVKTKVIKRGRGLLRSPDYQSVTDARGWVILNNDMSGFRDPAGARTIVGTQKKISRGGVMLVEDGRLAAFRSASRPDIGKVFVVNANPHDSQLTSGWGNSNLVYIERDVIEVPEFIKSLQHSELGESNFGVEAIAVGLAQFVLQNDL